jgi:hypothetical protein
MFDLLSRQDLVEREESGDGTSSPPFQGRMIELQ